MGYDASKSEVEIMHELGHYRIWGCGQKKWIYEPQIKNLSKNYNKSF